MHYEVEPSETDVCPNCGCEHHLIINQEVQGSESTYRQCEDCDSTWGLE